MKAQFIFYIRSTYRFQLPLPSSTSQFRAIQRRTVSFNNPRLFFFLLSLFFFLLLINTSRITVDVYLYTWWCNLYSTLDQSTYVSNFTSSTSQFRAIQRRIMSFNNPLFFFLLFLFLFSFINKHSRITVDVYLYTWWRNLYSTLDQPTVFNFHLLFPPPNFAPSRDELSFNPLFFFLLFLFLFSFINKHQYKANRGYTHDGAIYTLL